MRRRDFLLAGAQFAIGSAVLRGASATPGTAARLDDEAFRKIEQRVAGVMRERSVPGVAMAIVSDGRLAWQRSFGVKHAGTREPVDAGTVFEAASVSKTVFAYVALKHCESGILNLDTPLTRFARQRWVADDARLDGVTPRHCLAHLTGLPEWRSGPTLKFEANPGERFRYSGEGYYFLQSVLTDVAGRRLTEPCGRYEGDLEVCATDFDAFMQRSLLAPLGMNASGYVWRASFEGRAAGPHDIAGRPLPQGKPNAADVARYGAAGELRTTATDYAKFLLAVLTQPTGDAFLGAEMHREMIRPQAKLDPAEKIDGAGAWALGWAVQERPTGNVILHSGGQSGFRSLTMASVERKSGFVILTNSDSGGYICNDDALGTLLAPLLAG